MLTEEQIWKNCSLEKGEIPFMNTAHWLSRDLVVTCTAIIHQFEMEIKGFISLISLMSAFSG